MQIMFISVIMIVIITCMINIYMIVCIYIYMYNYTLDTRLHDGRIGLQLNYPNHIIRTGILYPQTCLCHVSLQALHSCEWDKPRVPFDVYPAVTATARRISYRTRHTVVR